MKYAPTLLSALCLATSPALAQETQPAPTEPATQPGVDPAAAILQAYYDATGGIDAHRNVAVQRQTGTLEVTSRGVTGQMTILVAAPDQIRITIELPVIGTIEQGASGGVGWANDPFNGARIMADAERMLLTRGIAPPEAGDLLAGFDSASVAAEPEDVTVPGGETVSARRVDLTTLEGHAVAEWYAVEGGLLVKREATWQTDFGPEEQSIAYGNYQPVGDSDLLAAFISEQTVGGNDLVVRIEQAEANPELGPDAFAFPPAVQKLLE